MRRLAWVLHALASHWRRHPLQAAAALAGIALATALWSGVQALNGEAKRSYAEAAAVLEADRIDRLEPVAEGRLTVERFAAFRRAGWAVSPLIEGQISVGGRPLRVLGIEPLTLPSGALGDTLQADGPGIAEFTQAPWRMLVAPETLAVLGIRDGEVLPVGEGRRLPPAVPSLQLAPDTLVMDIGAASELLGPALTALLIDPVAPAPDLSWEELSSGTLRLVPAGADTELDRLTASFHLNLTAFGFLAFAVGLLITHAAVGLAFEQRLGLFRTLRACGVAAAPLAGILAAELMLGALLAGVVGLAGGYLIAGVMLPGVAATLSGLYGAPVSGGLRLPAEWWIGGLAMALGGAGVAAGHTLARVYALPPLASARRGAWSASAGRARWLQAGLGAAALAGGAACFAWGEGLAAGFAVMAALMLGAVLLLPAALSGLLRLAERGARGPVEEWAAADARQQLSGLGLALMALMLALAATIGVGTMVEGFRTTFEGWLERRLIADLYVDPPAAQVPEIRSWLAEHPEVAELLETRRTEIRLGAEAAALVGRPAAPAYRSRWPLLTETPAAWDRLAAGDGMLASEQLVRRLGLELGGRLALPAPNGPWEVELVGIYADYGNPKGELTVGRAALEARWPGTAHDGFGAVLVEGAAAGPIMAALEQRFGALRMTDAAGIRTFSLRVFERTFQVTALLTLFTLGVAGVALFASLLTLADLRLAGLAPLWASGVARSALVRLELAKTVGLALLTALVAIPVGLALAWVLVAVVNVAAFGWRLPFHLFPWQWLEVLVLAGLTAAIAAALPLWNLSRMPPAKLVKIFSEER